MKKKGCVFEYHLERDDDLLNVFWDKSRQYGGFSLSRVMEKVIVSPSKRFWVSEARAARVISKLLKGENIPFSSPKKREMYEEILSRTRQILTFDPNMSLIAAVTQAVNSEAPEFYLTIGSAIVLFYRALHRKRKIL